MRERNLPSGNHDGSVQPCKSNHGSLGISIKAVSGKIDEPVRLIYKSHLGVEKAVIVRHASDRAKRTDSRTKIVDDVPPGKYTVRAEFFEARPNWTFEGETEKKFELDPRGLETVSFKIKPKPFVRLKLVDADTGAPIAGATVRLLLPNGVDEISRVTSAKGIVRFRGLEDGEHRIAGVRIEPKSDARPDGETLCPFVFRSGCKKVETTAGASLKSIATANPTRVAAWQELAWFNFGSDDPRVVKRGLFETIGLKRTAMRPDQELQEYAFDGHENTRGGTGVVRVPRAWQSLPLEYGKTMKVPVRRPLPAPAIALERLDKWFVPGDTSGAGETCDIDYGVEGVQERADSVKFEVFGSHYAKAELQDDGSVRFTEVDVPVYAWSRSKAHSLSGGRTTHAIRSWSGQSSATDGMLKPRENETRYLNVAFSPYTVHLRHFQKDDADGAKARLVLQPFWPRWDTQTPPQPVPASLKIAWEIKDCSTLRAGSLLVHDCTDKVVFSKRLAATDVSAGAHTFDWDGTLDDGTALQQAQMPYRVQLQVHSGAADAKGVALAAMHTEVRLFVHPRTGEHAPVDAHLDPSSARFGFEPHVQGTAPTRASDENRWVQYRLNELGFHAGPVDGAVDGASTALAIREYQRSVPRNAAAPYTRLPVTGAASGLTKDSLENVGGSWKRAPFGDGATLADLDPMTLPSRTLLRRTDAEIAVWVDDRHVYTDADPAQLPNAPMGLGNYRGGMEIGDGRVAADAAETPRPWVPLSVDFPLVSKANGLDTDTGVTNKAVRALLGPLRVDFRSDDVDDDLGVIDPLRYDQVRTRTRRYVRLAIDAQKATLGDGRVRTNLRDTLGGVRPADDTRYMEAIFGTGAQGLPPWKATFDAAREVVSTRVHDDLGQAAEKYFESARGLAGVYLRPSLIAGDGYRVVAKLGLADAVGDTFPNRATLEARYPKAPEGRTAALRVWRRTSYRGHLKWTFNNNKWAANQRPAAQRFRGARLHFVEEPTNAGAALTHLDPTAFMTEAQFTDIIHARVNSNPWDNAQHRDNITLSGQHVWPYASLRGLGFGPYRTVFNTADNLQVVREFVNTRLGGVLFDPTWRSYRSQLMFQVLAHLEKTEGRLRGHVIIDFDSSPKLEYVEYNCDEGTCRDALVDFANNDPVGAFATLPNSRQDNSALPLRFHDTPCRRVGCTGKYKFEDARLLNLGFAAAGVALGGAWLFDSGDEVWAHEMGHHRHLEHAQAQPGDVAAAPGAKNIQHDSVNNPAVALGAAPPKDHAWDLECIMSYNNGNTLAFCGKCILKMRGWRVEGGHAAPTLANPPEGEHD